MLAILPILAFLILWLFLAQNWQAADPPAYDWRDSFLAAAILWGAFLTTLTEALSLFHALAPLPLALAWASALLLLLAFTHRRHPFPSSWRSAWRQRPRLPSHPFDIALLAAIALFALLLALTAWVAPPNTNNSLAYHMARIMHWAQNRSLAHYPTAVNRQLWTPLWAETTSLQLFLLAGSDRLANFVQWFSMLGCLLGLSRLAHLLGASRRGQLLTALFALTIPMGLLQASSTQTDLVVAFWLVALARFALPALQRPLTSPEWLLASAAVGLGVLTKGTFYAFALPFLALLAVATWRHRGPAAVLRFAALGAVVTLAFNAGPWLRNLQTYQFPLGPVDEIQHHANNAFAPAPIASNLIRNITLHLATPVDQVNTSLYTAVDTVHQAFNQGINDPRTTLGQYDIEWAGWRSEDFAGNPLHVLLIPITILFLYWRRRDWADRSAWIYTGVLLVGALAFATFYKWQPFGSRLQLPFFLLWAPLFGLAFGPSQARGYGIGLAAMLLAGGVPFLLLNPARPLIGIPTLGISSIMTMPREEILFANQDLYREPYLAITEAIRDTSCRDVGLKLESYNPEYPLWSLLSPLGLEYRIESLDPNPSLKRYVPADFQPCAIICTTCIGNAPVYSLNRAAIYDGFLRLYLEPANSP